MAPTQGRRPDARCRLIGEERGGEAAGIGSSPRPAHQALKTAKSDRYTRRVAADFSAKADLRTAASSTGVSVAAGERPLVAGRAGSGMGHS
jgi:hypothetical protein